MIIRKAQSGIVWAVITMLIFFAIVAMVISNKQAIKENSLEYEDDYANSILYTILRSSTNSTEILCSTTKDILLKYKLPGIEDTYCCGIYSLYCKDFITRTLEEKLNKINSTFKKSYYFYFEVGMKNQENEIIYYTYGNESIKNCKGNKISAIQYLGSGRSRSNIYAKVIIMRRGEKCLR